MDRVNIYDEAAGAMAEALDRDPLLRCAREWVEAERACAECGDPLDGPTLTILRLDALEKLVYHRDVRCNPRAYVRRVGIDAEDFR